MPTGLCPCNDRVWVMHFPAGMVNVPPPPTTFMVCVMSAVSSCPMVISWAVAIAAGDAVVSTA